MNLRSRLKNAFVTFQNYASTSTIHGLLHVFQSTSTLRQGFWVMAGVFCFLFGLYHFRLTLNKYMNLPVTTLFKPSHEVSKFPYVTICNMKPVSEALFHRVNWYELGPMVNTLNGRKDYWDINSWMINYPDFYDTKINRIRRKPMHHFFQTMWVSGDTRDISSYDKTMVLDCNFNGVQCNHKHFKLKQNSKYWNCYTFDTSLLPDSDQLRLRGHQLDMTLFADAVCNDTFGSVEKVYCICPNSVMSRRDTQAGAFRLFLHQKDEYPMSSTQIIDIQAGRSSTITLNPLHEKHLSSSSKKCTQFTNEKVEYISYFGVHLLDANNKKYVKAQYDYVYEEKQNFVFNKCNCYSHRYPFSSSMRSKLCYFIPREQWRTPSTELIKNIQCHNEAADSADKRTIELVQKHQDKALCNQIRYRPMIQSLPWPKFEYIRNIWEDLFVPKIINGIEFTARDTKKHHIFNYTTMQTLINEILKDDPNAHVRIASREELVLLNILFDELRGQCNKVLSAMIKTDSQTLTAEGLTNLGWCIMPNVLLRTLAHVQITLPFRMSDVYEEVSSFEWTEAVSEIGGTYGLWIGVSLLVTLELLELFIVVIVSFVKNERLGHSVTIQVPIEVPIFNGSDTQPIPSISNGSDSQSEKLEKL